MTAAERARGIVDEAFKEWTPRPMSALDAKEHFYQAIITRLTRALLAHEAEVRRDEREACARLFEGTSGFLNWLCLDHGGEEAERIAEMIRERKP